MFGCIGRVVVGLLLIVIGAVGWHYRALWVPRVKEFISAETGVRFGEAFGDATLQWGEA